MSGFNKEVKVNKNKRGKEIEKVMELTPKTRNGKITLEEVNNLYKSIQEKTETDNIMIKAMTVDGYKTLKSFDYNETDLIHTLDDYYNSLPKDKIEKFKQLLSVQIILKL